MEDKRMKKLIVGALIVGTAISASGCSMNRSSWMPRSDWADNTFGMVAGGVLVGALMGTGVGAAVAALGQTPLITGVSVGAIAGGLLGGIGGGAAAACADGQPGC
jgi:hypothetical protein